MNFQRVWMSFEGPESGLWVALVHESDRGAKVSSAARIGYFTANEFGLPSSNIRFKMLHAISASDSCDSG
jgi:hypothetical protein